MPRVDILRAQDGEVKAKAVTSAGAKGTTTAAAAAAATPKNTAVKAAAAPPGKPGTTGKAPPAGKAGAKAPPAGKAGAKAPPAGKTGAKAPPAGKATGKTPPAGKGAPSSPPQAVPGGFPVPTNVNHSGEWRMYNFSTALAKKFGKTEYDAFMKLMLNSGAYDQVAELLRTTAVTLLLPSNKASVTVKLDKYTAQRCSFHVLIGCWNSTVLNSRPAGAMIRTADFFPDASMFMVKLTSQPTQFAGVKTQAVGAKLIAPDVYSGNNVCAHGVDIMIPPYRFFG